MKLVSRMPGWWKAMWLPATRLTIRWHWAFGAMGAFFTIMLCAAGLLSGESGGDAHRRPEASGGLIVWHDAIPYWRVEGSWCDIRLTVVQAPGGYVNDAHVVRWCLPVGYTFYSAGKG